MNAGGDSFKSFRNGRREGNRAIAVKLPPRLGIRKITAVGKVESFENKIDDAKKQPT